MEEDSIRVRLGHGRSSPSFHHSPGFFSCPTSRGSSLGGRRGRPWAPVAAFWPGSGASTPPRWLGPLGARSGPAHDLSVGFDVDGCVDLAAALSHLPLAEDLAQPRPARRAPRDRLGPSRTLRPALCRRRRAIQARPQPSVLPSISVIYWTHKSN
jgi:hypothetical protein